MLNERITANNFSFFDRIKSIDYFLILIIISIGAISVLARKWKFFLLYKKPLS